MSTSTRFVLRNVRLSYPNLAEAKVGFGGNGEPKFSATFIIDKSDKENIDVVRKNLIAALKEKFTDRTKLPPVLRNSDLSTYLSNEGKDGWPLRDGDMKDKDGFAGMVFIQAKNKNAPFTVDAKRRVMSAKDFYAGCYVNAALEAYAWENASSGTKGVNITLHGVQFAKDGEAFGAAPVGSAEFFGAPEEDDANDPASYNI